MRLLVACTSCKRQYDASELRAGDRFRCLCGETVAVPVPRAHDAAVVRCSACGAPRQQDSVTCRFCSADFTVHERDLHTICPGCMTRVSDRARYCHHCATRLLPTGKAGQPTPFPCPVCGDEKHLTSRRLGEPGLGVLECPTCAGLWLANEELEVVLDQARRDSQTSRSGLFGQASRTDSTQNLPQEGPLYRPCPSCRQLMHRRNFGRKSGIVIDQCGAHGFWFDAQELESILRWVRAGGELTASRLQEEERKAEQRQRDLDRRFAATESDRTSSRGGAPMAIDLLATLLGSIFRH